MEIKEYIPDFFNEIDEVKEIIRIYEYYFGILDKISENFIKDQFVGTATEYGISRREAILDINPSKKDTLDDRRFAILSKYCNDEAYTINKLKEKLDNLIGKNKYEIKFDENKFKMTVKISLSRSNKFDDICKLLEESSNIILNSSEECLEDRLNTYQDLVEETKKVNSKISYIIEETENYQ